MGNSLVSLCFQQNPRFAPTRLIFWDRPTRILPGPRRRMAGEIMFEFPDQMVCHADSFFIGQPIRPLAIDDDLLHGQTYFVLPVDRFAYKTLTTSSLSAFFNSCPKIDRAVCFSGSSCPSPFEYVRGSNGRTLIKVRPEFIIRLINNNNNKNNNDDNGEEDRRCRDRDICNTPDLKKHYEQLVGSKEQVWSPKLETISEHKARFSPSKFLGLEWSQKEKRKAG